MITVKLINLNKPGEYKDNNNNKDKGLTYISTLFWKICKLIC